MDRREFLVVSPGLPLVLYRWAQPSFVVAAAGVFREGNNLIWQEYGDIADLNGKRPAWVCICEQGMDRSFLDDLQSSLAGLIENKYYLPVVQKGLKPHL